MLRDKAWLLDMLIAAKDAIEFADSLTKEQFENSHLHQYAILKTLEIVAKAASQVSESTKRKHPHIQWSMMSSWSLGLYATTSPASSTEIHLTILWQTVKEELPKLIAQLEPLVPPETE